MKPGIELIAEERPEQITKHRRTIELDVAQNKDGELLQAADALISKEWTYNPDGYDSCPESWDADIFNKMYDKPQIDRLKIAGALIAAEIDRLQHISLNENASPL